MEDFAQVTGVSAKTLYNYANQDTQLNMDFLIRFAQLGGDVQYVVTGVRSNNLPDLDHMTESERVAQRVLLRQMQEIINLLIESMEKGY
jgi:transcriptional regulator with XRE-family HTH domain